MRIVNIRLTRTDKEELNMEKIIFQSDDGTAAEFYVEEQTNIAGVTYLLSCCGSSGTACGNLYSALRIFVVIVVLAFQKSLLHSKFTSSSIC